MSVQCFWRSMLLLLLLWPGTALCQAGDTARGRLAAQSAPPASGLEEKWGIRIISLRQSAAGYMLDFRYRVLDPKKAAPIFDRQTKPYLIDQASGEKFRVPSSPKVGPLRSSNMPKADRVYGILFGNPGRFVQQGNKVTVVIGDFKAKNLVVY